MPSSLQPDVNTKRCPPPSREAYLQQGGKQKSLWALCTAACAPAYASGKHDRAGLGGIVGRTGR